MLKKFIFLFLITSFLTSCITIEFGTNETIESISEEKNISNETIKQYNLQYREFLGKNMISKGNCVPEDIFVSPDGQTQFIVISFPKIGILKTNDDGETFIASFFNLPSLCSHFGYNTNVDSSARENGEKKETIQDFNRILPKFGYNSLNTNEIYIILGQYIFTSSDNGDKWSVKKIFFDENAKILHALVTKANRLIVFTSNKIAYSDNWGKNWKQKNLQLPDLSIFNTKFIDAIYDNSTDTIFLSAINNKFALSTFSKQSYQFFYQNKKIEDSNAAVYYSKDNGKTWNKTNINVACAFFKSNNKNYITSVFPSDLYDYQFNDTFIKDELYKNGKLTAIKKSYSQYLSYLNEDFAQNLSILSQKRCHIAEFSEKDYTIIENPDFCTIYDGMYKLQYLDFTQFIYRYFEQKISSNFFYEFNQFMTFKKWTAMKTNNPILYTKGKNSYYRMIINEDFWKKFTKYAIENQVRINTINPFLKKMSDIEFINPELDISGFPVVLQRSTDNGETWQTFGDIKHFCAIIDPLNNKRSGFFWYKNVEQKKNFKLQFSFGHENGINYVQYPLKLLAHNGKLYILLNYFTFTNSYKDLYIIQD